MSDLSASHNGLKQAVDGRWNDIEYGTVWRVCKAHRGGLRAHPGSDNIGFLAWAVAFLVWRRQPRRLSDWMEPNEPRDWWLRDMRDRRDFGLMLDEEDARIYFGWHVAPIYVVWRESIRVGEELPTLAALCRNWLRAMLAKAALCAVPVRPRTYEPDLDAKFYGGDLFVPLCGARSWSADQQDADPELEAHHMGSSAFESVTDALIFATWRPPQPAHQWELDVMSAAGRPRSDLINGHERMLLRDAIMAPESLTPEEVRRIADMAAWTTHERWPQFLVRFERGGACVRQGRAKTISTAPLYAMAIHDDGTVHYLAIDSGKRGGRNIDREPCGFVRGHPVDTGDSYAWAGGEDLPVKEMHFPNPRWGDVLWIVDLSGPGLKEVVWPKEEAPPAPPPPEPPPDDDDDRRWYQEITDAIRDFFRSIRRRL